MELKRGCEDVIATCAEPVCAPLRVWIERVRSFNTSASTQPGASKQAVTAQPWATQAAAAALLTTFHEACARDLRNAVGRLRLYLEDDRTVSVLVKHVQERIIDEFVEFRRIVWDVYGGALRAEVGSEQDARAILRAVCEEPDASSDRLLPGTVVAGST